MNNDILSLLGGLSSTPNWQYQLGLASLQPQVQANQYQYQLGQSQLANQLAEFQAQQALAQAQQQWQQQFSTTGQQEQYGLQSAAQAPQVAGEWQQNNLESALFPWQMAQAAGLVNPGGAGARGGSPITGGQKGTALPSGTPSSLAIRPGQYFNSALAAINPAYASDPMFSGNLYGA